MTGVRERCVKRSKTDRLWDARESCHNEHPMRVTQFPQSPDISIGYRHSMGAMHARHKSRQSTHSRMSLPLIGR
jgi:hypothetical protein